MAEPFRVAVAGAGMVTAHHLPAWADCHDAEVVALCDHDRKNADLRARTFGIDRTYGDLDVMLDRERPDILDIALPPGQHGSALGLAADRGIAVLCQKPLAPTLHEADAIAAAIDGRIPVMIHENWRFREPYRHLKSWIVGDRLGDLQSFAMSVLSSGLLPDGSGRRPALDRQPYFRDLERFLVVELLIHHFDTLAFLFGPVRIEAAVLENRSGAIRAEDTARIHLTAGPLSGTLDASFAEPGEAPLPVDRLTVTGTAATARLDGWSLTSDGAGFDPVLVDAEDGYQASYTGVIRHFVDALRHGNPFETPLDTGLAALAAVESVYASAAGYPTGD